MGKNILEKLQSRVVDLPIPNTYFKGLLLEKEYHIPDSILMFYHLYEYGNNPARSKDILNQSHNRYVLLIPFSEITYWVDDEKYNLEPKQMMLVLPHLYHRCTIPCGSTKTIPRLLITFEAKGPVPFLPDECTVFRINHEIVEYLENIITLFSENNTLAISIELLMLFRKLSDKKFINRQSKTEFSPLVLLTLQYINKNCGRSFTIQEIAEDLGCSVSHLRMLFKKETHHSLGSYIADYRLSAAKQRLVHTNMSVTEIATSCGYESIQSFYHFFKNKLALSPLQYRSLANKKTMK